MKVSGIGTLSAKEVDEKAEEVIGYFAEDALYTPKQTPIALIVSKLSTEFPKYAATFDFTRDLGHTPTGRKILGLFLPKSHAVLVDPSLMNTDRFNFALAHELGHLVLHRNASFEEVEGRWEDDEEVFDVVTGKKELRTELDFAEWQANRFASSFLMPESTLVRELLRLQDDLGITRRKGIIYVDEQRGNRMTFRYIVGDLAHTYQVSRTNVIYRLKDLGRLDDMRLAHTFHISQIFKDIL